MKICCISDTHSQIIPDDQMPDDCQVLIHAGDLTNNGKIYWLQQTAAWFRHLVENKYEHLICVAGNHDFILDAFRKEKAEAALPNLFGSNRIHYLRDDSVTLRFPTERAVKFYGTPWVKCGDWAFSEENHLNRRQYFNQIPSDTDVLISHGPPYSILDRCIIGSHGVGSVGDLELLGAVERVRPALHVFGHIHDGYGLAGRAFGTRFVNAASTRIKGSTYQEGGFNPPIVVDIDFN
jgi:Icc-related predicted phosphoesterase